MPAGNPLQPFTAIVLAGDRGPGEALTRAASVCCKALVPVAGEPMLLRVMDSLSAAPSVGQLVIAGLPEAAIDANQQLRQRLESAEVRCTPRAAGPSAAAAAAANTIAATQPLLITTADHALLKPRVVNEFLAMASVSGLDVVAAVIRYPAFQTAYPGMPKTVMRFSDDHYCGCNLFALLSPRGRTILDTWQTVERQRKTPWKTISLLGWRVLLRYLSGRLSIGQATDELSRRLGINVGVVELPWPDAAIDVDSVADWHFVERLITGPAAAASPTHPPSA